MGMCMEFEWNICGANLGLPFETCGVIVNKETTLP
jgi:hypothetical protein